MSEGARRDPTLSITRERRGGELRGDDVERSPRAQRAYNRAYRFGSVFGTLGAILVWTLVVVVTLFVAGIAVRGVVRAFLLGWGLG